MYTKAASMSLFIGLRKGMCVEGKSVLELIIKLTF